MTTKLHDYRRPCWGHAIGVWDSDDGGRTVRAMGHGPIRDHIGDGDGLLVRHPDTGEPTAFAVETIEYDGKVPDMWVARLRFLRATEAEALFGPCPPEHPMPSGTPVTKPMKPEPVTFTCALCGKTFDKAWSDDEAEAELGATFPGFTPADCDEVCDDCYRALGLGAGDA